MSKDIEPRLDAMDRRRDDLLGALSARSPEQLAFRSGGTGWNALDVVQHLVLVEESVLGYARKKLQAAPQPVSFRDRCKLVSLVLVLRSPLRVAAPAAQVIPRETLPLDALSGRWREVRKELRELLRALPAERRTALFFRHPIAGPLDPAGTLTFIDEHVRHHDSQLRRLSRAPGFPG